MLVKKLGLVAWDKEQQEKTKVFLNVFLNS